MRKWLFRIAVASAIGLVLFGLSGRAEAVAGWAVWAYVLWRARRGIASDFVRLWSVGKSVGRRRSFATMKGGDL